MLARAAAGVGARARGVTVRTLSAGQGVSVDKFIRSALASKGISGADETATKLKSANIESFEMLKSLSMTDWEKSGVSVGAARAIQDALWQMKHDEEAEKLEKHLSLRRENSTKAAMKQKRL